MTYIYMYIYSVASHPGIFFGQGELHGEPFWRHVWAFWRPFVCNFKTIWKHFGSHVGALCEFVTILGTILRASLEPILPTTGHLRRFVALNWCCVCSNAFYIVCWCRWCGSANVLSVQWKLYQSEISHVTNMCAFGSGLGDFGHRFG